MAAIEKWYVKYISHITADGLAMGRRDLKTNQDLESLAEGDCFRALAASRWLPRASLRLTEALSSRSRYEGYAYLL